MGLMERKKDGAHADGITSPWNPKQLETNGCSNMAIEILYIGNGCLGKHPFLSGWDWGSRSYT